MVAITDGRVNGLEKPLRGRSPATCPRKQR
jgi:hypothetical protein